MTIDCDLLEILSKNYKKIYKHITFLNRSYYDIDQNYVTDNFIMFSYKYILKC